MSDFYNSIMDIAERIRRERKRANLTQQKLADRIRANKSAVAQWETGRTHPTSLNLIAVAQALAIPVARLTGENDGQDRVEAQTPDEAALLRLFRNMTERQQTIHLNLFYSSTGLAEPVKLESDPSERGDVVPMRAVKQKT